MKTKSRTIASSLPPSVQTAVFGCQWCLPDGHMYCFACDPSVAWKKGDMELTEGYTPSGGKKQVSNLLTWGENSGRYVHSRLVDYRLTSARSTATGRHDAGYTVQIADYYDRSGTKVGQKVRDADKNFTRSAASRMTYCLAHSSGLAARRSSSPRARLTVCQLLRFRTEVSGGLSAAGR
ncbi:primase/helicase protein [Enterobacter phage 01_vB_Eclo_IJM]|nr:primase/helicase protein [Enterobacter phage 01_vB_Eclo_IJM]